MIRIVSCYLLLIAYFPMFGQDYEVMVHPGQELLTTIQLLADKYPEPNPSSYYEDFKSYFNQYADHPAVSHLKNVNKTLYPDFAELGWCFYDYPQFKLNIPDSNSWYELYDKRFVQEYLQLAKQFALDTKFWEFYMAHLDEYGAWSAEIVQEIENERLIVKLHDFYQTKKSPKFYIAMDPLNGWGAHAVPHVGELNPRFAAFKAYSIGYFSRRGQSDLPPTFKGGDYLYNLVWHEGSHIYLDEILEKNGRKIQEISYLFNQEDAQMKRQNIDTWDYCFEENLVRGIVISLTKKYLGERAYKKQCAKEVLNEFIYAEDISNWIDKKYLDRSRSLDELMPKLIKYLSRKYVSIPY